MWVTAIALPLTDEVTQDPDGFPVHKKTWLEHIPAERADATRSDETLAKQMGYTVSRVYHIDRACYTGQGSLIDESDGVVCDIKRAHTKDKSNKVILTVEVRDRGKI